MRVLKGVKVESLDPESETLLLSTGRQIKYSKVLLATGGSPKRIPVADQLPEDVQSKVLTFRSLDDFKHLSELQAQGGKIIAIVGGGFLGSELAAALAQKGASNGNRIVQLFPEDGNMGLVFPRYLTKWTTTQLRNEGVDIKTNAQLTSMVKAGDKIELHATGIEPIEADYVVLAVGLSPNVEIAQASGLELDEKRGGILVNAELEARSNVFAAGDCTSFHDITLGRRRRVEHYDHAVMSGQLAGLNMTGAKKPYTHLSMFWSDLGPKVAYEAVGIIDSSLQTVGVWAQGKNHPRTEDTEDEYNKGIVYYLNKDKKLVGVLLFNTFGEVDAARELLKQGTTYQDISKFQTALVSMV